MTIWTSSTPTPRPRLPELARQNALRSNLQGVAEKPSGRARDRGRRTTCGRKRQARQAAVPDPASRFLA